MSVSRLAHITPIGVEQMGDLADSLHDPAVLRLENLDTDLRPPASALAFTRQAVDDDGANSYLPFFGLDVTRQAAAELVRRQSGQPYDWKTECIISAGGLSGILNVLLATLEPGDEVLLTDPIYVGLVNRVRLAGGVPRSVPLLPSPAGWRLDLDALAAIDPGRVRVALLMSPSMPTGAVFTEQEWEALVDFCRRADCWLVNDAAMERILFDGRAVIHPAAFPGMRERVITVGAASKEYRMIGWRVGWVVGPAPIIADVARVSLTNVICQIGIAMGAVATAIRDQDDGIVASVAEWQRRRDVVLEELAGLQVIPPHGGWSLLLDVSSFGLEGVEASRRLLQRGKIAATAMVNWGSANSNRYVRFVFANEPVERLRGLGSGCARPWGERRRGGAQARGEPRRRPSAPPITPLSSPAPAPRPGPRPRTA
jgi:aspartate/methionine/tyrosine aminotransferase